MNKSLPIIFLIFFCFTVYNLQGQTTLINPATDGGFENGTTFAANGWTAVNPTTTPNAVWNVGTLSAGYTGARGAYISNTTNTANSYTTGTSRTAHFYKNVTIPAGNTQMNISFSLKGSGETNYDRLLVYTAPTTTTPTANSPLSTSTALTGATLRYTQGAFYTTYTTITIPAFAVTGGTNLRIIFTWQNDASGGTQPPAAVDNISVVVSAPCSGTPTGGTSISSVANVCSGVNFTVNNTGHSAAASGITYVWQSSPNNATWTNIGTASATYADLSRTQTTATYYRLLTTCTNSGISTGSSSVFVSMSAICYCLPTYSNLCSSSDFINLVSTTGGSTNISNTASGCSGAANNYSLHTATSLTVQQGNSFTINLQSGASFGQGFGVWIDYNQNGTFETTEYVYSAASGTALNTGTISVPITATVGATRMRVRCAYSATPVNTDACTNLSYGETEDYNVTVTAAPSCTGTPTTGTASASPTNLCSTGNVNLSLTGNSTGLGITFQWQSSPNNSTWTNISGATTTSYTVASVSAMTYFRCVVGCINSGLSANTASVQVTFGTPVGATFASPILVGTLGCTAYTNTLNNTTTNCYGNDLTVGTNQGNDDIFYQFVLSNPNNFSTIVRMGHCGTTFDTYIHLLNSAGALIVENDDNGAVCTGTAGSLQQTLASGAYYVVSEGFGTNSGSILTTISIPAVTGTGAITGTATICAPTTGVTYTIAGYTNATGYIWTVPTGVTITAGQGTATITVSFVSGASSGNVTCTPYNGPCAGTATTYALTLNSVAGTPTTFPTGQWNVYAYNAGDATGGSGAWTNNYAGYYTISNLSFDTQTGQTNSTAQSWANTLSPSSASGYLGCPVGIDNHSYVFKRQGVGAGVCGTFRIDALNHDDAAILKINGVEVWRHVNGCCDIHTGIWSGYLDASSQIEYYISEGSGGSNAALVFTQIATSATITGANPTTCGGNGTITASNIVGGYANIISSGFGSAPSGTTVYGAASITGEECVLTSASASLLGNWGIVPTIRPDAWEITYQQYIGGGSGADGMSFSYGGFTPAAGNGGEMGFGTGLTISFDTHNGATNSQLWIYYDGAVVTSNAVNAVNLRTATYVPVTITINSSNQVTVVWNGTTIFSNVALPAGYASANKSAWNYAFSARTGGATDIHKVDNVNLYAINYFDYSINGTTWQTSNVFTVPQGSYTVQARHRIGTSCITSSLGSATLSNPALPTITLGTVVSVCSGATSISLPYSATTNSPNQYSITAGTPAMASFIAVTNAAIIASPLNIIIPASTAANTYQFNITVTNSTTACTSTNQTFNVTVASVPSITTISPSTATFCPGGAASNFTATGSGGTGTGGAYQWQYSTGGIYANFTNGSGTAPYYSNCGNPNSGTVVITPFSSAGTGIAIRCIYTTAGTGCTVTSPSVSIGYNTTSVAPTSAFASAISICSGTNINLTSTGGSAGTGAVLKWYSTSCGGTLVGTGSPLSVAPTSSTTYYSRYEGTCNTTICATVAVAVTPAPTLSASFVSPLCYGNANGSINLTVSGLTPTITFDGTINEAVWGSALATSSGGPAPGFAPGHELNALYATADETYSYFAIAGNVQSGNRILLFLDSKTGGYNTANFDRTNAPSGINAFNSATTFDAGFAADYCLVIGTNGSGTYYYDLFSLAATGSNNFLGTNGAAGLGASPANSSNTQGFEIRIPNSSLGYVGGGMKAFAAYISDGGYLSNQFLTKAGSGDGNYTDNAVSFGAATPNPLTTSNLTYAWSNSSNTQDLSNIAAGTYSVTVSSASSCTATTSVTVTQPAALVGNTCITTSDFCQAGTGAVKVVATGGTPPYNITWSPSVGSASPSSNIVTNGGFTNIINIIGGTSLSVSISDANGCQTP